jgi:hypothetical protein
LHESNFQDNTEEEEEEEENNRKIIFLMINLSAPRGRLKNDKNRRAFR